MSNISRRKLITGGVAAAAGVSGLAAAASIARRYGLIPPDHGGLYGAGETLTYAAQRLMTTHSLAREFPRSMISKAPFANATAPANDAFKRHQAAGFSDWRLTVDGMVAHPTSLSLADIRGLSVHNQITEVACEEGWSYIAEWIGTPLRDVLKATGLLPEARYIVYFSIEPDWWESIDMADALHPQTFLTWGMNDAELPVVVRRSAAVAGAAPARLQEREIHNAYHGHRFAEGLWQRSGLRIARSRLCVVRRNLAARSLRSDQL